MIGRYYTEVDSARKLIREGRCGEVHETGKDEVWEAEVMAKEQ